MRGIADVEMGRGELYTSRSTLCNEHDVSEVQQERTRNSMQKTRRLGRHIANRKQMV